jgi:hypothetical protein
VLALVECFIVNVLYVLLALVAEIFAGSQMAIDNGEIGGVNLKEQQDSSLVSKTILKAGLDLQPLIVAHSLLQRLVHEDQGGDSHHMTAGEIDEIFVAIVKMFLQNISPSFDGGVVVFDQYVIGI